MSADVGHAPAVGDSPAVRAARLHAAAKVEISASRPAAAVRLLEQGLEVLDGADPGGEDDAARVRVALLISLAHCEVELSHVDAGLGLLEQALSLAGPVAPELVGRVHAQRGLSLMRLGRYDESLASLDRGVQGLSRAGGEELARSLLNRGALRLRRQELAAAATDLEAASATAAAAGRTVLEGKARHNLGYLALVAGDLPKALADFETAERLLLPDRSLRSVLAVDRARALAAAGLLGEADGVLADATAVLEEHHLDQDLAEAELVRAQIALVESRGADATRLAQDARRRLRRRGNTGAQHVAALAVLQARTLDAPPSRRHAEDAERLAGQLQAYGLREEARIARLVAERIRLRLPRAPEGGGPPPRTAGGTITTRLMTRLIRADHARVHGDQRARDHELRTGLRELHDYARRFGSLDLQSALGVHGRELAAAGLADALTEGRPSRVLAWAERSRALTTRLPPLRPPEDPETARLLQELRLTRMQARAASLAGRPDRQVEARCRRLEEQVTRRDRSAGGGADALALVPLQRVQAELGDACLVSLVAHDGRLHGVRVTRGSARLVAAGDLGRVEADVRRVRADLDVLALRRLDPRVREVVTRSLAAGIERLDSLAGFLLDGVRGAGPLVVVPCAGLAAMPWGVLPRLRGRPVCVVGSATAWVRQRGELADARRRPDRDGARAVLVLGPGVERGVAEVADLAGLWPDATRLEGPDATARRVIDACDGADLLHVAAHGRHAADNPMFSEVQLHDGPLFGHDLPGLRSVPRQVVLSSCELGVAEVRPGDEAVGMTSALLHHGAASVVAGVARVADDAAHEVMVRHHRGLRGGSPPAVALAAAQDGGPLTPFVCFGAGW